LQRTFPSVFQNLRIRFDIVAPQATPEQLKALREKTEQYCVVMQTLVKPPNLQTEWVVAR
jgi:uncharacterized OsmC-like protein